MKTDLDARTILYKALKPSSLQVALTGNVYSGNIPKGAIGENVAINAINVTNDQFQQGVLNVNIHVPDLYLSISNTEQYVEDTQRLKQLAALAIPLLDEIYTAWYRFRIIDQHTYPEPEINQHYVNFRIDFLFFPD